MSQPPNTGETIPGDDGAFTAWQQHRRLVRP
jgi:hypothetical protein